jgi:peptidoglycan/LPS O-acetylase OafA/YrhL
MSKDHLKGLTPLRFFAAFFVIISHGNISLEKMGFAQFATLPFFNRGGDAVEFFFVLSGFLITYLLQKEIRKTGTVSIRKFYLRRVFRIWPLYFLIITIGFVFLGLLYPKLTGQRFFEFPLLKGLLLFVCFLPNYATSLYPTGLMYPLWSIGVEEQYYLFWAPLVKGFRKKLPALIALFLILAYTWYCLIVYHVLHFANDRVEYFFKTQKFYAMATGAFFGLVLFRYADRYRQSFLSSPWVQGLVLVLIAYYYIIGYPFTDTPPVHFFMTFLYGLLVLSFSALEKPIINLEIRPLVYLGNISYGLYMFHMTVDYVLRFFAIHFHLERLGLTLLLPIYLLALLSGTIVVASLSYKYFESYFLRLKEKYA